MYNVINFTKYIKCFQDWADGEFSRAKDKLRMHVTRHQAGDDYVEVTDSSTFSKFGKQFLEKPGPRSGIERRTFHDLKDEDIKKRTQEVEI